KPTKIFEPPRFTPFAVIGREYVSATSMVLTVRPRAGSVERECGDQDPYAEAWERGPWSVEAKQPELQIARAYTPLPPLDGNGKRDLRFLIRREERGEVSRYLHGLPLGAQVELRGPKTEAELPAAVSDVVFLAGGTGIAPALQVVYTLLERRKGGEMLRIRVVWANRKREDCIGGASAHHPPPRTGNGNGNGTANTTPGPGYIVRELQNLQRKYPQNLQVQYVVDEEGTALDQKRIAPLLNIPQSDARTVKYSPVTTRIDSKLLFVSGPDGFVDYLAGPKKWEGGKEGQGELGGRFKTYGGTGLEGVEAVKWTAFECTIFCVVGGFESWGLMIKIRRLSGQRQSRTLSYIRQNTNTLGVPLQESLIHHLASRLFRASGTD
ncbi:NADH-cytochrome b5 reductase 1, partial [Lachnellula arida]